MNIYQQSTHAHSVAWNTWHFEWCTKYRHKIFKQDYIKNLCLIAVTEAAKKNRIEVLEIEVSINHIHVIASIPMTMSPSKALNLIKGFSAYLLFRLVPNLRLRYFKGHLWSKGKFMASVGHITLKNAKKYLEGHHAKKSPLYRESPPFRVREEVKLKILVINGEKCTIFYKIISIFWNGIKILKKEGIRSKW